MEAFLLILNQILAAATPLEAALTAIGVKGVSSDVAVANAVLTIAQNVQGAIAEQSVITSTTDTAALEALIASLQTKGDALGTEVAAS